MTFVTNKLQVGVNPIYRWKAKLGLREVAGLPKAAQPTQGYVALPRGPGCPALLCLLLQLEEVPAPGILTRQSSWEMGLLLPGWLISQIFTQPLPPV
jgi:hypothetical protein